MEVTCQCGTVRFTTPYPSPLAVYHCHCRDCQRQSASAFSTNATFPAAGLIPLSADLSSKLKKWTRGTDSGRTMDCYFCKECGARVLHQLREADGTAWDKVNIKGGLVTGLDWKGAPHIWMKRAVVEAPEGVEQWEGQPPGMVGKK
jgi:hypothetical protein